MTKENNIGLCKFCNTHKKLINAHIIPKSFFMYLKKDAKDDLIAYNTIYRAKSKSGVFDKSILCKDCDNCFSKYENEVIKFFRLDLSEYLTELIYKNNKTFFYNIPNQVINSKYLMMFFVSLLWKCSISKRNECLGVNLGMYEDIFKYAIKYEHIPDCMEFTIAYYADYAPGKETMFFPVKTKYEGINYYEFYFNGFDIRIKVDKRRVNPFKVSSIQKDSIIVFKLDGFKDSSHRNNLFQIMKKTYDNMLK